MVSIPVEKKIDLDIDSFWYFQTDEEKLSAQKKKVPPDQPLDPLFDGYCLTRSDIRASSTQAGSGESDYNIIHSKWRLTYQIVDPVSFYKNVYITDPSPGQVYFDVVRKDVTGLLKDVIDSSVVSTMVNFTIEEALFEKFGTVAEEVKALAQRKLDLVQSGIRIVSIQRVDNTWPLQVNEAFLASINASQIKQQQISEATTYAQNTINEAGGPVAVELLAGLHDPNTKPQTIESLWLQVAGRSQQRIADARAYRKKIVEGARADAAYLKQILPEYKKRPTLVLSEIYRNAMSKILNNANEKFFVEPVQTDKGSVIMIKSNSDPTLKPK
jgi:modulator of FtsH protease HflK